MQNERPNSLQSHYHVSGVGGVGMNAIAQLLKAQGHRVTGSDRFWDQGVHLPVFDALQALGIELTLQDGHILTAETRALVISTAVEADNPERVRARELGISELHRAEALVQCVEKGRVAAIAGTSGKTTCTGWLGRTLEVLGFDPGVVNGGGVLNWKSPSNPGNVRLGQDPKGWWVVEVDESDRSLLRFHPEVALITGMAPDHHDAAETLELFRAFARQVQRAIVCGPGVRELLRNTPGIKAQLVDAGDPLPAHLPPHLPGAHNALNAAAVAKVAEMCGASPDHAREALGQFHGVERRLELCTPPGKSPKVYDDYAHNPEKIAAAIRAVRPENGKLIALWRPHGFAPLRQNFEALAEAFAQNLRSGDEAWILPVFYAGGTAPKGVEGKDLAQSIQDKGTKALALEDYPETVAMETGDVLLVMGARDPELPRFARRIAGA
ncbi:MAG: hypothetical protein JJU29_21965 [Verrucomicrobia bacterium]|nr:hypothetical protein [Verrucomicrobiota bacterium]MCH8512210.1 Mur ligase domain-containing protein [Kiritimatiellia bacterium]